MIKDNGTYQVPSSKSRARMDARGRPVSRLRSLVLGTRYLVLAGVGSVVLSGCTDFALYDLDRAYDAIPALSTLRGSVAYDPYELPRLPAEGSVPVDVPGSEILPAFTQAQLDSVGAALTNPLPMTPEVLALGQQVYDIQCAVCHGPQGEGNGSVVGPGKYPTAPAVNTDVTAARSDGYIYGVIRVGRGLMPSYSEKVDHQERWAVVNYLRMLQQGGTVEAQESATPQIPTVVDPPDSVTPAGMPAVADTAQDIR